VRSFLANKRYHFELEKALMKAKGEQITKDLVLLDQSVLRLCNLYFMQFIYADKQGSVVKYTLREITHKLTITELRCFELAQFRVQLGVEDMVGLIEETLIELEEHILVDEEK
jgi:hypothetical protein